MPAREIAGKTVQVNDEGFMTDATEWDEDIALAIAREEGLSELTEAHWVAINWMREKASGANWKPPSLRQINKGAGVPTKQLFVLFPNTPAKKAAKIAGLTKPEGCV
jgi:dissimilatory sulfite reductase related protein